MERQAYLERELKSKKGQMKKRLWNWGQALEKCAWKQDEMKKQMELWEMQREMREEQRTESSRRNMRRMEKEYEEGVKRLQIEMEEILLEKRKIDGMLKGLTMDEENFVRMRFEKGYGFEFIALKMHLSRATLFRMQEKILKKLIDAES